MGGENSAPLPSNATDENDGAAVCNHFSSLQQIVGIPMGEAGAFLRPPVATLLPKANVHFARTKNLRTIHLFPSTITTLAYLFERSRKNHD